MSMRVQEGIQFTTELVVLTGGWEGTAFEAVVPLSGQDVLLASDPNFVQEAVYGSGEPIFIQNTLPMDVNRGLHGLQGLASTHNLSEFLEDWNAMNVRAHERGLEEAKRTMSAEHYKDMEEYMDGNPKSVLFEATTVRQAEMLTPFFSKFDDFHAFMSTNARMTGFYPVVERAMKKGYTGSFIYIMTPKGTNPKEVLYMLRVEVM